MRKFRTIHLKIADLIFKIKINAAFKIVAKIWLTNLQTYYKSFLLKNGQSKKTAAATISLEPKIDWQIKHGKKITNYSIITKKTKTKLGFFNHRTSKGDFDIFSSFYSFDLFFRSVFTQLIKNYQGAVLHASSIAVNKEIFVFCAPKQTGKSTIAALCPFSCQIYSDDNTIIRRIKEKIFVFPTPFIERKGPLLKKKVDHLELKKLYFISQGKRDGLKLVKSKKEKLLLLWENIKTTPDLSKSLMKLIDFYQLKFAPKKGIWQLLISSSCVSN